MDFVDDKDLETCTGRFVFGVLDKIANIINLAAGGGVHLYNVDMAPFVSHSAVFADFAGSRSRSRYTHQGLGKNTRRRGLSRASES